MGLFPPWTGVAAGVVLLCLFSPSQMFLFIHIIFSSFYGSPSHLREVEVERVGVVLPRNADLGLRGRTLSLDLGAPGERQVRLLRDQLEGDGDTRTHKPRGTHGHTNQSAEPFENR